MDLYPFLPPAWAVSGLCPPPGLCPSSQPWTWLPRLGAGCKPGLSSRPGDPPGGCACSCRHQLLLLEADKDLQTVRSSLLFNRWGNGGSERGWGLAELCRANWGPGSAIFPRGRLSLAQSSGLLLWLNRTAPRMAQPLRLKFQQFPVSFSLPSVTYLFWDQLNHPRNRASFSSQQAPTACQWRNRTASQTLEPCKVLTLEQLQVLTPPGKLAGRLKGVIFHLPAI